MIPFGLVFLFLALGVAAALMIAITWRGIDLLKAENKQLRVDFAEMAEKAREGWADAGEGWAAAAAAQHRVAELLATDDSHALARLHAACEAEGLTEWPWGVGVTNDPRYS